MHDIDEMIEALIAREGGYVNDPDDPGGATKYGVTIHTLSAIRGRRCLPAEVRALTKEEARQIYIEEYLCKPRIDELPDSLQPSVFDMYVNAGSRAVKLLQDCLNKFGFDLAVDGVVGARTITSTDEAFQSAGQFLIDAYGIERREFYYRLADRRAASRKYARTRAGGKGGWIKRAEEFISPRYQLDENEHRQRTKNWG